MAKPAAPKSVAPRAPVEGEFVADFAQGYKATRIMENGDTVVVTYQPAEIRAGVSTVTNFSVSINRKGILTDVKDVGKTDGATDLLIEGNADQARTVNLANTSIKKAKPKISSGDTMLSVVEAAYRNKVLDANEAKVLKAIAEGRISVAQVQQQMQGRVFPDKGFYSLAGALRPTVTPSQQVAVGEPTNLVQGGKLK